MALQQLSVLLGSRCLSCLFCRRKQAALDAPPAEPAAAKQAQTLAGLTGCEYGTLGPSSQAGPAHGSWRAAVPCARLFPAAAMAGAEECPSMQWGISLSGIQIGESATCGKIQAQPRPLINNGLGPFHCPERRSFRFTNGFAFNCSGTNGKALQ